MTDRKYVCQECGCLCESCVNNNSLHLHREIEVLRQQVLDRDYHIVQMDTRMLSEEQHLQHGVSPGDQALREELRFWQEKYNRLLESHRKLQKVNQSLEDKLLRIVDKYETEKNSLTRDITDLSSKLVSARYSIAELEEETEQYRNDCNVAVHLLQCKPSSYLAHKFTSLPADLQESVKVHFRVPPGSEKYNPPPKTISVSIPTFPPTAVVYAVNKVPQVAKEESSAMEKSPDLVSVAIMAKVLEERAKERTHRKDCSRCNGHTKKDQEWVQNKATQTTVFCNIHTRRGSESSPSSTDSSGYRVRQPSITSTETII